MNLHWYKNAVFYEVDVRAFRDSNGDGRGDLVGLKEKLNYVQDLGVSCICLLPLYAAFPDDNGSDIVDYSRLHPDHGTLGDLMAFMEAAHARDLRVVLNLALRTFSSGQSASESGKPEDLQELKNDARFWLDAGIDGLRIDAPPKLSKSQNDMIEGLRSFMDQHYPGCILFQPKSSSLGASTQPDEASLQYGFQSTVMPRIFLALKKGDLTDLADIQNLTTHTPEEWQGLAFLRDHAELTLEHFNEEERQWMWEQYAPEPRMRFNLGIRRRLAPLLGNDRRKIELAISLLMSLADSPLLYYGDEIGMGDNIWLEGCLGLRTPMQWTPDARAGFSEAAFEQFYAPVIETEPFGPKTVNVQDQQTRVGSLFHSIQTMLTTRKQHRSFGWGDFKWMETGSTAVAAYQRKFGDERLVFIHNLTDELQSLIIPVRGSSNIFPVDILGGRNLRPLEHNYLSILLAPYRYLWLKL